MVTDEHICYKLRQFICSAVKIRWLLLTWPLTEEYPFVFKIRDRHVPVGVPTQNVRTLNYISRRPFVYLRGFRAFATISSRKMRTWSESNAVVLPAGYSAGLEENVWILHPPVLLMPSRRVNSFRSRTISHSSPFGINFVYFRAVSHAYSFSAVSLFGSLKNVLNRSAGWKWTTLSVTSTMSTCVCL